MTALTDARRMARKLARGSDVDERVLLAHWGAEGPPYVSASQSEIAESMDVTRQAVHIRLAKLMSRITPEDQAGLTLDADTRARITRGEVVDRKMLGGLRLESAVRFYRQITGEGPPRVQDQPLERIPAAQFDALIRAAYGVRVQARLVGARLVLVRGMSPEKAAGEAGIPVIVLLRAAQEILELHRKTVKAYGGMVGRTNAPS